MSTPTSKNQRYCHPDIMAMMRMTVVLGVRGVFSGRGDKRAALAAFQHSHSAKEPVWVGGTSPALNFKPLQTPVFTLLSLSSAQHGRKHVYHQFLTSPRCEPPPSPPALP